MVIIAERIRFCYATVSQVPVDIQLSVQSRASTTVFWSNTYPLCIVPVEKISKPVDGSNLIGSRLLMLSKNSEVSFAGVGGSLSSGLDSRVWD